MGRYLIKTVETYRVANEKEAKALIEEAKADNGFTLIKYQSEARCTKKNKEVIDEWQRVVLTKEFTEEKDPICMTSVSYQIENGYFPSTTREEEYDDEGEE